VNDSYQQGSFKIGLASENHWSQPMMALTVQWWPTPVSVGGLFMLILINSWFESKPMPISAALLTNNSIMGYGYHPTLSDICDCRELNLEFMEHCEVDMPYLNIVNGF
jgi:hypothetical protein